MKSHNHEHINPDRFSDSAGVPWEGRTFEENPFADDDGSARPELLTAIKEFHQSGNPNQVFFEITKSRLLIPLLADLGEAGIGSHGQTVDKSADLSIVTVATPDNKTAIPVFSSVGAMQRWNAKARPVPADAIRVALAAASEGTTRIVLDAGSDSEFALRRAAISAIAQQHNWVAPFFDDEVLAEFKSGIEPEEFVSSISIESGDPKSLLQGSELIVTLGVKPGLANNELEIVLYRIMERWANSKIIADRVDSMSLVVKPIG
ncbi:MAG: SseB family protein [Rhodoluna sp.]